MGGFVVWVETKVEKREENGDKEAKPLVVFVLNMRKKLRGEDMLAIVERNENREVVDQASNPAHPSKTHHHNDPIKCMHCESFQIQNPSDKAKQRQQRSLRKTQVVQVTVKVSLSRILWLIESL